MEALILVAHADDETLGAGGTIQILIKNSWMVKIVIISNGILDVRGTIEDNRAAAESACKMLGAQPPVFLGYADQKFDQTAIADIANTVMNLKLTPDLIITHSSRDLNLDHRITCEVAKICGRPKNKPISILECEIPNASFWGGNVFRANYFVDISQVIDKKIEAFSKYENELQEYPHPWSKKGLRLLAEYHGMQSGCQYAEAFELVRGYGGRLI